MRTSGLHCLKLLTPVGNISSCTIVTDVVTTIKQSSGCVEGSCCCISPILICSACILLFPAALGLLVFFRSVLWGRARGPAFRLEEYCLGFPAVFYATTPISTLTCPYCSQT